MRLQAGNYGKWLIDACITAIALPLAYFLRFETSISNHYIAQLWVLLPILVASRLAVNGLFKLGKQKWAFIGTVDLMRITVSYLSVSIVLLVLRLAVPASMFSVPLGVIAMEFMCSLLGAVGARVLRRLLFDYQERRPGAKDLKRILLIGAGRQGAMIAREMVMRKGLTVLGFLDDDPHRKGSTIAGVRVLGPTSMLAEIVERERVSDILVCLPPSDRQTFHIDQIPSSAVRTRIMPTVDEVLQSDANSNGNGDLTSSDAAPISLRGLSLVTQPFADSKLAGKTILITGGAGFIGSALARRLVKNNQVILFDVDFERRPVQYTELPKHPNVQMIQGDLLHSTELSRLCREVDIVVHAAAIVGVSRVCESGRDTLETNYVGTSRLLKEIEQNKKLSRLLYFSTSEVFGVNSFRVDESSSPTMGSIQESRWSYAIAKLAGEHLVKSYYREANTPIVIVRPFNVFGPRRTGDHALKRFVLNALDGKPLELHGDGSQIRSWCYIEDFCSALVAMLEKEEAIGEDFNVGHPGNTVTIGDLAQRIVELSGSKSKIVSIENPFPDITIRVPSIAKATALLGYKPKFDLDSALRLTIDWYRENRAEFASPPNWYQPDKKAKEGAVVGR